MFRRRYIYHAIQLLACAIILHNECLTYLLLLYQWPHNLVCSSGQCVRLLLVADPQILGEQDSSWIARWDVDRYLSQTFSLAVRHVRPDVVVFLGDLMDEGHIASDDQFQHDLRRFQSVFNHTSDSMTIFVPGDNDIGGEGDPILPHVVHRFNKVFDPLNEPLSYQSLEFYKVNRMTQLFQEPEATPDGVRRIALSHVPLLRKMQTLSRRVAAGVQPQVIFSGHDHKAAHITAPLNDPWNATVQRLDHRGNLWNLYLLDKSTIHELTVPTCSYRMGVARMGYGYVLLDQPSGRMSYSTLQLPARLSHLLIYLYFLGFLAVCGLCWVLKVIVHRVSRQTRLFFRTYQKLPHYSVTMT